MQIRRLDHRRGAREPIVNVLRVDEERVARRLASHVGVEISVIWQIGAWRPRRLQLLRSLDRLPWRLAHDADEVFLDHDLHDAGQAVHRRLVHADQRRTDCRWTDDASVQHPGYPNVVHELELSRRHRVHVDARNRRAQDGPFIRRLPLRRRVEREIELLPADQLAIADPLRRVPLDADHAIQRSEAIDGHGEAL